jgi:hypothetical protein
MSAAIVVTPVRLLTCTGILLSVVVPSPNCPKELLPQAKRPGVVVA